MKRFYPNGPTAAELEDLRVFANRTEAVGLFIGPQRYYTFNDLPSELTKPVQKNGDDKVASHLSRVGEKKSSTDLSSAEGTSKVHGVGGENRGSSAQDEDAIKRNDAAGANRVGRGDVSDIDDDDAENADSIGQAKLANQSTPAGQAGSDVDLKNDSTFPADSDTNPHSDTVVNSIVEDDFGLERVTANAQADKDRFEVPLYSEIELKALDDETRSKIGSKDADDKLGKRIMALALRGNKRRLMALSNDWTDQLDRLSIAFQHRFEADCILLRYHTRRRAKPGSLLNTFLRKQSRN